MNNQIYLDNNATTRCDDEVYNEIVPYLKNKYGNPSSIYSLGKETKEKITEARRKIAELINAKEDEIIFTSCASESNVSAIMNAVKINNNKKHIISSPLEHSSIIETLKYLEKNGYKITYLSVDDKGRIDLNELESSITKDTFLITIMMANNELGNIYPVQEIGHIAKKNNILFHCDCVQALGKIKIDVNLQNIDSLSLSGHKIYAPKGIGVLYIKKTVPYIPLIFGHQENERRGGTENVPYIVGLGKAVELIQNNNSINKKVKELRDYMELEIKNKIKDVYIYGDLDNRLPNTSSIAFKRVDAEKLMLLLESFNIYVSTGSACNSENKTPSHVLTACNADLENYSPIRISLGKYNTKEEIDIFVKRLENIVNIIRKGNK